MSDIRFILAGITLVFVGFLVLGVFGSQFHAATVESEEFGECYDYSNDAPPIKIDCESKFLDKTLFFALVLGLIASRE